MSVNADSIHAIKDKVCLLMLTQCYQRQSVSVNADSIHAIKDKVCLLMLTACMLSKTKCVC